MEAQSQQQVLETVSFERDGECSSDFSSEEDHSLAFIFDGVIEPYSFEPDGTSESSTGGYGDDDQVTYTRSRQTFKQELVLKLSSIVSCPVCY